MNGKFGKMEIMVNGKWEEIGPAQLDYDNYDLSIKAEPQTEPSVSGNICVKFSKRKMRRLKRKMNRAFKKGKMSVVNMRFA